MKHKKAARETIKSIAIVLLILSAVILGWASRLFGNESVSMDSLAAIFRSITGAPADGSTGTDESSYVAGMPVTIAVADGSGGRYGAKYDLDELNHLYSKTFTVFSQALGSAGTPVETTAAAWEAALKSLDVFYEYLTPVSLSLLAGWYGADVDGDWGRTVVRRLCVTYGGGRNDLYFQDADTGKFYVSGTAARNGISSLPSMFGRNSAVFAFEFDSLGESQAPYTLLMPDVTEHPVLTVENPLVDDQKRADALLDLGVSENVTLSYPVDGGTNYIGSDFTVLLSNDGTIVYHSTSSENDEAAGSPMDPGEAVKTAHDMVADTIGNEAYCGDAAVYFDSVVALEDGAYQVRFRYFAFGGVVWLGPDGYAASVTVENGSIVSMELRFRTYTDMDQPLALLPEVLAEAAADGDFMLGYTDNGDGNLTPSWVRLPLDS